MSTDGLVQKLAGTAQPGHQTDPLPDAWGGPPEPRYCSIPSRPKNSKRTCQQARKKSKPRTHSKMKTNSNRKQETPSAPCPSEQHMCTGQSCAHSLCSPFQICSQRSPAANCTGSWWPPCSSYQDHSNDPKRQSQQHESQQRHP